MVEKTERTAKNGQSRDTGNIGHTRYKPKTNKQNTKTQHNTKKAKKMSNKDVNKATRR